MAVNKIDPDISKIPQDMKDLRQWICFKLEWNEKNKKWDKIPNNPLTGGCAMSNNPSTWTDFNTALQCFNSGRFSGIGFMFTKESGIYGVDIDGCFNNGVMTLEAQEVVNQIQSYTEWSPSKNGVHIIAKGILPPGGRRKGSFEMYDSGRFFTVTGWHVEGTPIEIYERTNEVAVVHGKYIAKSQPEPTPIRKQLSQSDINISDDELVGKILKSKQGFDFQTLWDGDTNKYNGDDSAADMALCNMLAFWTGREAVRMDALFRQSALYRHKWDERHFSDGTTYGVHTINKAIKDCCNIYDASFGTADHAEGNPKQKFFNRTDAGNAELLADACGDKIRYCFEYGKWLIYDGKRWKIDTANHIYELAKKTAREAWKRFTGNEEAQSFYRSSESKAKMTSTVFLAQSLLPVSPSELDPDNWLLNAQNGVINLRNGELLPHDPKYFMTKICKVAYIPNNSASLWQESLVKIIPDKTVRDFIQRFAGYSLTGSTREEKFLVLNGEGGTGKGTVTETLADLLGDYADTLSTDVLLQSRNATSGNEPTPEIAKLPGVRLLLASETGQGRMLDEPKVKALTGGDRIPCRRLRCDPFTFQPNFKLWLSTNHVPRVRGNDDGVWRRIRLVPFGQQFKDGENRDNTVKERLHHTENLQSVLTWAVEGCLEWQRQGLKEAETVIKTTNDFRNECDIMERFFADECEVGPKYEAPVKMFYRAFKEWCIDNGHLPSNSSTFRQLMESKKYIKTKKTNSWVWPGIRLASFM